MSNITILSPLAGTVRSFGFQSQKPFTSPDMVNFVPFNPKDGRAILASRPFLTDFATPGVGGNLLELVSGDLPGEPSTTMVAAVDGELYYFDGTAWQEVDVDASEEITTGRAVFGAAFYNKLFIANDDEILQYDYSDNELSTPTATSGSFPDGARVLATHMGALWATGSAINGNVLYGSGTGDPLEWDFTREDEGAPFQTTGDNAGLINQPNTALIPLSTDTMVIAQETSMLVMLGHPSRNGMFMPLSPNIGVLGQGAWCKLSDGSVLAMSRQGLVQISSVGDGAVSKVSEKQLPLALKGIAYDRLDPRISLAYDAVWNGVHIVVRDDDVPQAWWYDLANGGFHRISYGEELPIRLLAHEQIAEFTKSGVVYLGDGYGGAARWTKDGPESNRPQAWAFLGPVRLHREQKPQTKSKISRAKVTLSNDTEPTKGTVAWYVGTDAEDAFLRAYNNRLGSGYAARVETLQNNNGVCFPNLAGAAAVIVIGDEGSGEFGLESIDMEITAAGTNLVQKVSGLTYDLEFGLDTYSPDYNQPAEEGFAQFVPDQTLSASVTDSPNFIDLSQAPARWWRGITSEDGREIKATDTDNNRLPMHVLWIDTDERKGMVAVKETQDGTAQIRLWTKTDQSAIPAVGSTHGQHNAYASWIQFLWALGDGVDVTSNGLDHSGMVSGFTEFTEAPGGFRAGKSTPVGVESVTTPSGDTGLFYIVDQTNLDGVGSGTTFSVSKVGGALALGHGEVFSGGRASLQDGDGIDAATETVAFPASTYWNSWSGIGAVYDFGTEFTLHLPTGQTDEASAKTLPAGSYGAGAAVSTETPACMYHLIDGLAADKIKAYFDMLHHCLDGEFWKAPVFYPAAISGIIE